MVEAEKIIRVASGDSLVVIDGRKEESSKVCVFVHFHPLGIITPIHRLHIKSIAEAGFDIWLVSSGQLRQESIDDMKSVVSKIIVRPNEGRDFGAYFCALRLLQGHANLEHVLLVNDSVYGPLFDLKPIIKAGLDSGSDIFGMTDSWDKSYHVQSYFMLINKRCLDHAFFKEFLAPATTIQNRQTIIDEYEIGITSRAILAGFKVSAYCNTKDVINTMVMRHTFSNDNPTNKISPLRNWALDVGKNLDINVMHFCWQELIETYKMPYIKRELIAYNQAIIPHIWHWKQCISKHSDFSIELIEEDLKLWISYYFIHNGGGKA